MTSITVQPTVVAHDLRRHRREAGLLVRHVRLLSAVAPQVEVGLPDGNARLWEEAEPLGHWHLSIMLAVVVGTMRFLAEDSMLTLLYLEEVGMVFLLFPTVRVGALVWIRAALPVGADEVVDLPVWAHLA